MYEDHPNRLGRRSPQVACDECRQTISVRLLRSVRLNSDEASRATFLCLACLTLDLWRCLAADFFESCAAAAPSEQRFERCDRCKRRSRPTQEHLGFKLCGECAGPGIDPAA